MEGWLAAGFAGTRNAWLKKPSSVNPSCAVRMVASAGTIKNARRESSLDVAAETENETRDKVYDARGNRVVHVLQVDDYRNFLAKILTHGGGILKVPRTHYCDLKP